MGEALHDRHPTSDTSEDTGPAGRAMAIDSAGLGYTSRRGEIWVHYPTGGEYQAGWPIGPLPDSYLTDPPNAVTAERVRLWLDLREQDGAPHD